MIIIVNSCNGKNKVNLEDLNSYMSLTRLDKIVANT